MTIDGKIRDKKLQYDIKNETAKISALPSGKINQYQHLISEELLRSGPSQIIQQAHFTYSSLRKAFKK